MIHRIMGLLTLLSVGAFAQSAPSKEETMAWLQEKFIVAGYSESKTTEYTSAFDGRTSKIYSKERKTTESTRISGCQAEIRTKEVHSASSDGIELNPNVTTQIVKFSFGSLQDVKASRDETFTTDSRVISRFSLILNGRSAFTSTLIFEYTDSHDREQRREEGPIIGSSYEIDFSGSDLRDRVINAISHAMKLCENVKEPF